MKKLKQLSTIVRRHAPTLLKQSTPLLLCAALTAIRCEAAASPVAKFVSDVANEATGTWATAGAGIGLVTGLVGLKMDGGHNFKGPLLTLVGLSFALLSVNGIVAYLQAE
jgi:hypothetical protein